MNSFVGVLRTWLKCLLISINEFVYENKQVYPVHLSENRFEVDMELSLLKYE